jgi:hypothetical protein
MGDDMFTTEVEWLLRFRRDRTRMHRLALQARRYVRESASTQCERSIRHWKTPEAQRLHDDLDFLVDFLGDHSIQQKRGGWNGNL